MKAPTSNINLRIAAYSEIELAELLRQAGVAVTGTTPATDVEDATVEITGLVHVQIPSFGGAPGVVRDCQDGSFMFSDEFTTLGKLVESIRHNLEQADQETLQKVADGEDLAMSSGLIAR